MRVAATGDFHYCSSIRRSEIAELTNSILASKPDVILLAGDLTSSGRTHEFEEAFRHFDHIEVQKYAVLGNHDLWTIGRSEHHLTHLRKIYYAAMKHNIKILNGSFIELDGKGEDWVIIGCIGWYDYSFAPKPDPRRVWWNDWSYLPEPLKSYSEEKLTEMEVKKLSDCLQMTQGYCHRLVLLHCAPSEVTVQADDPHLKSTLGFMGSTRLGDALISNSPVDAVFHGHAHVGKRSGKLESIPIYNTCVQLNLWKPVIVDL